MAVKYKKGAVRRYPKRNSFMRVFGVAQAMIKRGEDFAYLSLGSTGKVKVIK